MNDDAGAGEGEADHWIREALGEHERSLMRYATGLLHGDLERARDVVQESFLRLCRQDRRKVAGHVGAWLFRVCRNQALDVQRKERRMTHLSEETEAAPASTSPPGADLERADELDRVMGALQGLPPKQQEALRLKFQHGHSYKEIARITDEAVGTVGWLIHEGIQALRGRLTAQEQEKGANA